MTTVQLKRAGRETLAESVYESLLEAIVSGELPSGKVLSEVAVAKELDVSRTPVHNALLQLARDGLVEQSSGRRARVATFTRDDLFEIFELRCFLEGPAAERAAGRMDQRQTGPLRATAVELKEAMGSSDWSRRWTDHDDDFHSAIAEASGNKRLAKDINRCRLLHRGFNLMANPDDLGQAVEQHFEILDALESRDGTAARAAMENHIRTWQAYFFEHFPN